MKKILVSLILILYLLIPFTANSQMEIQQPAMTTQVLGNWTNPLTGTQTLTATQAMNMIVFYGATGTINLPNALTGMNILIYNTGAFTITVDPQSTDKITIDGTENAAGHYVQIPSGAGNFVTLLADSVGHWTTLGYKGTLVAE